MWVVVGGCGGGRNADKLIGGLAACLECEDHRPRGVVWPTVRDEEDQARDVFSESLLSIFHDVGDHVDDGIKGSG